MFPKKTALCHNLINTLGSSDVGKAIGSKFQFGIYVSVKKNLLQNVEKIQFYFDFTPQNWHKFS